MLARQADRVAIIGIARAFDLQKNSHIVHQHIKVRDLIDGES
jgi:hypothetical protein